MHRKTAYWVGVVCILLIVVSWLARATSISEQTALALVNQQLQAQANFDAGVLEQILADTYTEVSPVGEIDPRAKVIGFYDASNKRPGPTVALEDVNVRLFGDIAVVIARAVFSLTLPDNEQRVFSMTGTWVVQAEKQKAVILSSQFTPVRK
ncbi:nuclear transport factor 2 family protein [Alteromonas lipolytica]|nr:nuclear transport factor 2 family protein [Alteromonas lipolytica]GGF85789.1 hypothetical protein GCM10011338_42640 [Alteromonas lipolytica]